MLGSAVIGGFILAMIEGTGILINRYSQMLMPQPGAEGKDMLDMLNMLICSFIESPPDLDKGKLDLSVPPFFGSSPGQSSSPSNFS